MGSVVPRKAVYRKKLHQLKKLEGKPQEFYSRKDIYTFLQPIGVRIKWKKVTKGGKGKGGLCCVK